MELKDTVELMNSKNYKDRFIAEYLQLRIRYEKLKHMLKKLAEGKLNFTPTCPKEILLAQLKTMNDYLIALEVRACFEEIELPVFEGVKENKEEADSKEKTEDDKKANKEEIEKMFNKLLLFSILESLSK